MPESTPIRRSRALTTFVLAYVAITILAITLSLSLEAAMRVPPMPAAEMVHSPSYVLSEKIYPVLNLAVWTAFSWVYFRPRLAAPGRMGEALRLGLVWLALALIVDYVGFVWIRHPYSLSAHDFYVGQFPWIYLIYAAIVMSPPIYVTLSSTSGPVRE
jgi:hypothetical protein